MNNTRIVGTVRTVVVPAVFGVFLAVLAVFVLPAIFASFDGDGVQAAQGQSAMTAGGSGGNGAMGDGAGGQGGAGQGAGEGAGGQGGTGGGAGEGSGGSEEGGGTSDSSSSQDQEGSDEGKRGEPPTTPPKGGGEGGEGEEPTAGNNLSFPVVAADGFAITTISEYAWEQVYDGPYTGLSAEQQQLLEGHSWYAQKTEGNLWQAEFLTNEDGETLPVYGVDWGDIVEAVHPVVGRPFRLEVTLYHQLSEPLQGFTMALLAFPSSPDEVQGTNQVRYDSDFATIVSSEPKLVIQIIGDADPAALEWNGEAWEADGEELPEMALSFGPELNVGGKYIFGASKGGWRPVDPGMYRITFYLPDSDISLSEAVVGNFADWTTEPVEEGEEEENGAATPVVDHEHNLTYADVEVVTRREGMKPENPGEGEEEELLVAVETAPATLAEPTVSTELSCEPYLTDYLGLGLDNDPTEVVLLQQFLNETLGTNIPLTGYFGTMTFDAVVLFQVTYADDILQPWLDEGHEISLTEGTGYVYITTLAKINEMVCEAESS